MSDEQNIPEGQEESQAPVLSPTQQQALESGWVPKEEFSGDPEKWVDAAEFLRRGELFKKIEAQSRDLKDMRKALVEMKKLHADVQKVEYQRALETIRAQKKAALEEGDADAVLAADDRIYEIKEAQKQLAKIEVEDVPQAGEEHPVFVEWKERNSWYGSNGTMQSFADRRGQELAATGMSPVQVLRQVEEEVKKKFPTYFQNPRQNRAPAVEGSVSKASSSSGFQLTPEERRIMQTFVRQGVMTEAEYIKDLKKIKGV